MKRQIIIVQENQDTVDESYIVDVDYSTFLSDWIEGHFREEYHDNFVITEYVR